MGKILRLSFVLAFWTGTCFAQQIDPMRMLFDRMDSNHDTFLSYDEFLFGMTGQAAGKGQRESVPSAAPVPSVFTVSDNKPSASVAEVAEAVELSGADDAENAGYILPRRERRKLAAEYADTLKGMLPYKADNSMTWTRAYEKGGNLYYRYVLQSDFSALPDDAAKRLKDTMKEQVCSRTRLAVCGTLKDPVLRYGVNLISVYADRHDAEMFSCTFEYKNCP